MHILRPARRPKLHFFSTTHKVQPEEEMMGFWRKEYNIVEKGVEVVVVYKSFFFKFLLGFLFLYVLLAPRGAFL